MTTRWYARSAATHVGVTSVLSADLETTTGVLSNVSGSIPGSTSGASLAWFTPVMTSRADGAGSYSLQFDVTVAGASLSYFGLAIAGGTSPSGTPQTGTGLKTFPATVSGTTAFTQARQWLSCTNSSMSALPINLNVDSGTTYMDSPWDLTVAGQAVEYRQTMNQAVHRASFY